MGIVGRSCRVNTTQFSHINHLFVLLSTIIFPTELTTATSSARCAPTWRTTILLVWTSLSTPRSTPCVAPVSVPLLAWTPSAWPAMFSEITSPISSLSWNSAPPRRCFPSCPCWRVSQIHDGNCLYCYFLGCCPICICGFSYWTQFVLLKAS